MPRKSVALAAALVLTAGLAACATPTPYQPNVPGQGSYGGYSEFRVEPDRFRVNFQGNTLTSRETVEGYLLFRAAELTVEQDFDWFFMADRATERVSRTSVEPDPFYNPWYGMRYSYWRPAWRYYRPTHGWRAWSPFWGDPFWASRMDVRTVERFEASAEIVMGRGTKPAEDARAFDAQAVLDNLRPRIQYPAAPI